MNTNTIQIHSVYVKATAQQLFDAITRSEYTRAWGYGGDTEIELTPGGDYRNLSTPQMKEHGMGDVAVSGTVMEVTEPHHLVLTWAPSWMPEAEPTTLAWDLVEYDGGITKLTLTHNLSAAPELAPQVAGGNDPVQGGGGWPWALSGLKTLVETGEPMDPPAA